MPDDFVQVAPDSTGKKIDNTTETTGVGTVERQRVSVAAAGSNNQLAIDGTGKIGVTAAALPLPTGAATEATLSTRTKPADQQHAIVDSSALPASAATDASLVTVHNDLAAQARLVDTQPVSIAGTVAVSGTVALTGEALASLTTLRTTAARDVLHPRLGRLRRMGLHG